MPASQGRGGVPGNPYNSLTLKPSGRKKRPEPDDPRWETIMAIVELDTIETIAEFAEVCEAQRIKRGW